MIPRLKEQFNNELKTKIMSDLNLKNVNEIPNLEKIIINIGDGKAATDGRALESMVDELTAISGQKPVIRRAKKSIAGFKSEGMRSRTCSILILIFDPILVREAGLAMASKCLSLGNLNSSSV